MQVLSRKEDDGFGDSLTFTAHDSEPLMLAAFGSGDLCFSTDVISSHATGINFKILCLGFETGDTCEVIDFDKVGIM